MDEGIHDADDHHPELKYVIWHLTLMVLLAKMQNLKAWMMEVILLNQSAVLEGSGKELARTAPPMGQVDIGDNENAFIFRVLLPGI